MNFLAPLFLLGALAVALPVVFHLARRTARERTVFSSLLFLRPAPPRITRRNRLEHLLLLLLRCLVISLLALGFARPFLRQDAPVAPPPESARRVVVLVDRSASMRRDQLWADAGARAEAVLRALSPADQAALLAFDRELTPLVTFEQWAGTPAGDRVALARNRLASVTPGWAGTALDQALLGAAELLTAADDTQAAAGRRQIVLVGDFQAGSRLGALQGYAWPKQVELNLERLTARAPGNAGLQLAPESAEAALAAELAVRVRVTTAPDSPREQFKLAWGRADASAVGTNTEVYVPAGQSRVVSLAVPAAGPAPDRIVLTGDDQAFDNTLFVVPPTPVQVTVLYLGPGAADDPRQPRYFLERAVRETRRHVVRVVAAAPGETIPEPTANAAPLIVVTSALEGPALELVRAQLQRGKLVLFAPGDAQAVASLAGLPGLEGLTAEEGRFADYGLWGEVDFRHPLFAPFADPRFSDFTKIHFWKYRRLDASAVAGTRVAARFDNGDVALAELPAGPGRVVILASGWHPADSRLALSSKFVPLLYATLEWSGAGPPAPVSYQVGDRVPVPRDRTPAGTAVSVTRPGGATVNLAGAETEFADTLVPGVYRVAAGAEAARVAVNLDPAESRTTPLLADELERLGVPLAKPAGDALRVAERVARLQDAELESRQKLWRWVILATLLLLVMETWLAGWTARRLPAPAHVTS